MTDPTRKESPQERVEALWQRDHAKFPGMTKATFVKNCLFNGSVTPHDLGGWALTQDDLPDQVYESGSNGYFSMIEAGDGRKWYRADPHGPRVIVRVQLETVRAGGESKLSPERPPRETWGRWDDD